MKRVVLVCFTLLISCGPEGEKPEPDLSHFSDGLSLKLCDNRLNCQEPGLLVLLTTEEYYHDPFYWFGIEPTEVDNAILMAPMDVIYTEPARFTVKCDQVGKDIFGCGARKMGEDLPTLGDFNDGLELKLCTADLRCDNPGIMVNLYGDRDVTSQPFRAALIDTDMIDSWDEMQFLPNRYPDNIRRFHVECDEVHPDVFACGAQELGDE